MSKEKKPIEKNEQIINDEKVKNPLLNYKAKKETVVIRETDEGTTKRVSQRENPLGSEDVGSLLRKFAVPSVIAMLVGAMYNIVDQIFIGQGVGLLGNAATNVAFPVVTVSLAVALLLGIGAASNFNLAMGRGDHHAASKFVGNAIGWMLIFGVIITLITKLFLQPLLLLFGTTDQVMPMAKTYLGITAFGLPFSIFTTGGGNLIRADGSPKRSMMIISFGAIVNSILDPLFIFGFGWGIAGAAWATVIGQFLSFLLVVRYYFGFQSVSLTKNSFVLEIKYFVDICRLGIASFFNQIAMTFVQILMNNTLKYYGAMSPYGAEIPLATAGIVTKVNMMVFAVSIGIAQGNQPIVGFNYGAKKYDRVKKSVKLAVIYGTIASTIGFLCFQLFPRQILSLFGTGSEEYFRFATRYLRVFLFMTFINSMQPIAATFFTSIGKAGKGLLMSLTRQVLFLMPLLILLPAKFGIEGVLYAGPIADGAAAILAIYFLIQENKLINKKIKEESQLSIQ